MLLNVKGMRQLEQYLERLARTDLKKSHIHASMLLAHRVKDAVSKGYRTARYPRAEGTLEAYAQGKLTGRQPARKRWGGRSLQRSGLLARSVIVRKMAEGWMVQIDPRATYGGDPTDSKRNLSVERIAAQMENPKPIMIRMTTAMQGYLALLRRGEAGQGTVKGAGNVDKKQDLTGKVIMIQMEAKPIWEPVFHKLQALFPAYTETMQRHLKQRGARRFPGMKVR